MGENEPIQVGPPPSNPNIVIKIDEDDLSVGTARYTAAKHISKNLAMKPNGPGIPDSAMPHSNVEVHMTDKDGNKIPMTRRLIRYWFIKPLPNAVVSDPGKWQIVGLAKSDVNPLDVAPGQPASWNFEWDGPGTKDAPGFQDVVFDGKPFGQLQEFLMGNAKIGGAYYQVYTLDDGVNIRVVTTNPLSLSVADYQRVLKQIDTGEYSKLMGRRLFFMPSRASDNTTRIPGR